MRAVIAAARLRRTAAVAVAASLLVMATGLPAYAVEPRATEKQSRSLVNDERKQKGIKTLKWDKSLIKAARDNSKRMADSGTLSHSNLANVLKGKNWTTAGENVAFADTVKKAHNKFMKSSDHKANILKKAYTKIAVGIVKDDNGTFWVTQIFYG